jgi:preprotein translocase subunit SecE
MAIKEDTKDNAGSKPAADESASALGSSLPSVGSGEISPGAGDTITFEGVAPATIGVERYVHAAFFAGGVFTAYLIGKILAGIWNQLAVWPAAVRAVPGLLSYAEDQRPEFTMVIGAIIAAVGTLSLYRKPGVRQWADEVAAELYKVHWPDRELVTNGTVVVIAASLFATVYIGILDRIWAFITNLVYGA